MRGSFWRFKEECDRLEWKFRAGRLTRSELDRFCGVFGVTHLVGFGAGGNPLAAIDLTSDATNYNAFSAVGSPGYPVNAVITVKTGKWLYATSTGVPAFTTGSGWHALSTVSLVIESGAYVIGKGGAGGAGVGWTNAFTGNTGAAGGSAITLSFPLKITNNGTIAGGGGGGGSGASVLSNYGTNDSMPGTGGGGGGRGGKSHSAGGAAGVTYLGAGWTNQRSPAAGTNGTESAAGSGGIGAFIKWPNYICNQWIDNPLGPELDSICVSWQEYDITGGDGGAGGSWGAAGSGGTSWTSTHGYRPEFGSPGSPGAGGAAGAAVVSNGHAVTWVATGTRYGTIS